MANHSMQDTDIIRAINNCLNCARSCTETFQYCLEEKGTAFSGKHLSLLQFCVESCQFTARLLIAESNFYHQACELCMEVSKACAVECERYEYDEIFKRCAANCRRCAESCRGLTGVTVRVDAEELPHGVANQRM